MASATGKLAKVKISKSEWYYGRRSTGSMIFDIVNIAFLLVLSVVTLYPFLYVLFASLSNPLQYMAHRGIIWRPIGFSLRGYDLVLRNPGITNGFRVSVFVAVVGTTMNMVMSLLFAYVLSRKNLMLHAPITFIAIFTMYFSGGMIPTFFVVRALGLLDSVWSLILPGLISTWNVIILRTAFASVPVEMEESAMLDGAGNIRILIFILIPLIVPTIAAISLFYMVGHWNAWVNALIYIRNTDLFPLQLVLRSILIQGDVTGMIAEGGATFYEPGEDQAVRLLLRYSTVIVSMMPVIAVYPFIQKYFTKGIMIGAIKG